MEEKGHISRSRFNFIKIILLPFIIYLVFFIIRIRGVQPPSEAGMGEFITAINFIFGASIAYFTFILINLRIISIERTKAALYWFLISLILVFLAFDEVFMIHETLGGIFHIHDASFLILYGGILVAILLFNLANYSLLSWLFLGGFLILGVVSVSADLFWGEGMIQILGKEIDYEQHCESFGALSLSCCVLTQSITAIFGRNKSRSSKFQAS